MRTRWMVLLAFFLLPLTSEAYDPIPQTADNVAHVAGEKLIRLGCRRIDTAASSATSSGNWATVDCDANGGAYVNTELPAAITPTLTGMTVPASAPWVIALMGCSNGTTIDVCVGSSNLAHDAPAASANPFLFGGYANAAAPSDVSADLDAVRAWFLRNGAQAIQPTYAGILANTGNGVMGTGVPRVVEANDSPLSLGVGTTADAIAVFGGTGSLSAKLRLLTNLTIDPCASAAKTYITISQTTGTQLFTGTASNRTYICEVHVISATAQNVALVSGTGTVCATGTNALAGGTTAATGWNFAVAGNGLVLGTGGATVAKSKTDADNVCILMSSTGQLSGNLAYVAAPN